jgi:hypothetical protein
MQQQRPVFVDHRLNLIEILIGQMLEAPPYACWAS